MKLVFISNYMSAHQFHLSNEFYKQLEGSYLFVATDKMTDERRQLGWPEFTASYIVEYDVNRPNKEIQQMITDADYVIIGSAPYCLVRDRLQRGKITFAYTERLYKRKPSFLKLGFHWMRFFFQYGIYKKAYLLCASAYSAGDFARLHIFKGKSYKWGYFTKVEKNTDIQTILSQKISSSILWVARFIDWKHPEIALICARKLKDKGFKFQLNMIGNGVLEERTRQMIIELGIEDCVRVLGSLPNDTVYEYMKQTAILLFTSDRNEGWGAVVNEAMSSGCAMVANSSIGSAPFLIKNGENGVVYDEENMDSLVEKLSSLLTDVSYRERIAANAINTMRNVWNPYEAAARFIRLAENLSKGDSTPYEEGPCSVAPIIVMK